MRFLALLFGALPVSVSALQDAEPIAAIDPMSSAYLLKLTGGLLIVVISIFVIAWMFKKLNIKAQSGSGVMQIIAGLSVGTRERIVVLRVGEEQLLIGLSPGKIEKLHVLSKPLEIDQVESVAPAFAQKLDQIMGKRKSR